MDWRKRKETFMEFPIQGRIHIGIAAALFATLIIWDAATLLHGTVIVSYALLTAGFLNLGISQVGIHRRSVKSKRRFREDMQEMDEKLTEQIAMAAVLGRPDLVEEFSLTRREVRDLIEELD